MTKELRVATVSISLGLCGWVSVHAISIPASRGAAQGNDGPYTEVAKLRPDLPYPPDDQFGNNLSIEGDLLLVGTVGEYGDDGETAHLFQRAPGQVAVWEEIWAFDPEGAEEFGWSVDLDGRTAISWGFETAKDKSAIWVFRRVEDDPRRWIELTILREVDPSGETGGLGSAAVSEDTVVAGATSDDGDGPDDGAVYVFEVTDEPDDRGWVKLLPPDGGLSIGFGASPDIDGDTFAVSRPLDGERGPNAGAVWVYERQADGSWKDIVKLMGADSGPNDRFGTDLALERDRIAVVAGFGSRNNAVYLFERNAGGPNRWGEVAKLDFSDRGFGLDPAVALGEGIVVVGAELADEAGAAYVFLQGADGTWSEIATLTPSDGQFSDEFGEAVGISGRLIVVGADNLFLAGDEQAFPGGAVYVFAESDCVMEVSLDPPEVFPGESVTVDIHLEHNRVATVTVPFAAWIETETGAFVAGRISAPVTLHHGDVLDHRLVLTVPADLLPGRYFVRVGIERMQRGLEWRSAPIVVR